MKTWKLILAAALLYIATNPAFAAMAIWTGKSKQVQTVTYQWMWECEYDLYGNKFTKLFKSSCPSSIEVY